MKAFTKIFFIAFMLLQVAQAGRMFDPEMGRFISRDPLGYVDGMSLYNGYFAEKFMLDPYGFETVSYTVSDSKVDGFDIEVTRQAQLIYQGKVDFGSIIVNFPKPHELRIKPNKKKISIPDFTIEGIEGGEKGKCKCWEMVFENSTGKIFVKPSNARATFEIAYKGGKTDYKLAAGYRIDVGAAQTSFKTEKIVITGWDCEGEPSSVREKATAAVKDIIKYYQETAPNDFTLKGSQLFDFNKYLKALTIKDFSLNIDLKLRIELNLSGMSYQ